MNEPTPRKPSSPADKARQGTTTSERTTRSEVFFHSHIQTEQGPWLSIAGIDHEGLTVIDIITTTGTIRLALERGEVRAIITALSAGGSSMIV